MTCASVGLGWVGVEGKDIEVEWDFGFNVLCCALADHQVLIWRSQVGSDKSDSWFGSGSLDRRR